MCPPVFFLPWFYFIFLLQFFFLQCPFRGSVQFKEFIKKKNCFEDRFLSKMKGFAHKNSLQKGFCHLHCDITNTELAFPFHNPSQSLLLKSFSFRWVQNNAAALLITMVIFVPSIYLFLWETCFVLSNFYLYYTAKYIWCFKLAAAMSTNNSRLILVHDCKWS